MGFFGQAIKLLRRPSFRDFAWAFYGSLGLRVQADLVDTFTLLLMPYSPAHVLLRLRRLELGPLPVARESGGDASQMAPSAWFAARPNVILLALPESHVIRTETRPPWWPSNRRFPSLRQTSGLDLCEANRAWTSSR